MRVGLPYGPFHSGLLIKILYAFVTFSVHALCLCAPQPIPYKFISLIIVSSDIPNTSVITLC